MFLHLPVILFRGGLPDRDPLDKDPTEHRSFGHRPPPWQRTPEQRPPPRQRPSGQRPLFGKDRVLRILLEYTLVIPMVGHTDIVFKFRKSIPVADPGFSPGGCANSQNCYYFSNFCRKLHENERIWTPGGSASLAPPLDPPMNTTMKISSRFGKSNKIFVHTNINANTWFYR